MIRPGGAIHAMAGHGLNRLRPAAPQHSQRPRQEIHRHLAFRPQHAEPPFHGERDSGSGNGSRPPTRKPQPRHSEIRMVRCYGRPHRLHRFRLAARQFHDQVQIMDHQVQHHGDIQAARAEGRGAHRLKRQRPPAGRGCHHGPKGSREAFNMPHLQDSPLPSRERNQLIRLIQARRDGLFDEDMPPRRQGLFGQRIVKARGGGDDHGLRRCDHGFGCKRRGADLPGNLGRPFE